MNFKEIVEELEDETHLPIVPERIAKLVMQGRTVEDIIYIGVDINTEILRGGFVRLTYDTGHSGFMPPPYALPETGLVIKIYYARNQPSDYIDLVINKELLHVLDPDFVRTAQKDKVVELANHIRLPTEVMVAMTTDGISYALVDYMSDMRAVVAMVPEPMRLYVCNRHSEGKITTEMIADLFGIPLRYVGPILSDVWPSIRALWLRIPE